MRESEEKRQEEHRKETEVFPKWARRLQVGTKRLPDLGLTNADADEKCTGIFDACGVVLICILRLLLSSPSSRLDPK